MAAEGKIELKTHRMIKPCVPTERQRFFLSNFDFVYLRFNNVKRVLFYSLSPPVDPAKVEDFRENIIRDLKESLSEALVKFYPLAGRLHKCDEDGRFEIDCNDEGVAFVEAESDMDFNDLRKQDFSHKDSFKDLVRHHSEDEAPFLAVQVTFFKELRGLCIGATLRHAAGDGRSFWNFMRYWSRISYRSGSFNKHAKEEEEKEKEEEPFHDRHALQFPDPLVEDVTHSYQDSKTGKAKLFTIVPTSAEKKRKMEEASKKQNTQTQIQSGKITDETATKRFHFSEHDLARLKAKAVPGTSSFIALAAHFWRSVVRSREVPPDSEVSFLLLVDLRERMQPPLPGTYFGNSISFRLVVTTAGALLEKDGMDLAVELLKEAVEMSSDTRYLMLLNRWLANPQNMNIFFSSETPIKRCNVNVVSSPKFAVYETNFGWGRPERVQPCDFDDLGCMILFQGRDSPRSVDVWTRLPCNHLQALSQILSGF